jgi:hypothetical protein
MRSRHHTFPALIVLLLGGALAGRPAPAQAQQPGGDKVALRGTVAGAVSPFFTIPFDPPIAVASVSFTGKFDLLGAVTWVSTGRVHFNADGAPTRETDGLAVITVSNGDALFLTYSGLVRVTSAGFLGEQSFTIQGGKGRFLGATGSGSWRGVLESATTQATLEIEGVVSRPKP